METEQRITAVERVPEDGTFLFTVLDEGLC